MSSSRTSRSSTWSEMVAATSSRTGGPNRRRASSRSSACSRSSSRSSSTSSSALRVTRNRWCSMTCMPEKSWPRWAAISSSTGRNRARRGRRRRPSSTPGPARAVHRDEPRHVVGHLDPGEQLRPAVRVADHDGEVQRQARRCTGTGAPGRPPAASAPGRPAPGSTRAAARGPAWSRSTQRRIWTFCAGQRRLDVVGEAASRGGPSARRCAPRSAASCSRGVSPSGPSHRQAGLQPALQPGDAHHVELVEVAGEDGQELGPLQQRRGAGPRRGSAPAR